MVKPDADLPYEDEKFSYIVATRQPPVAKPAPLWRAIGHPRGTKVVIVETCQKDGTAPTLQISKRDPAYKQARRMKWGIVSGPKVTRLEMKPILGQTAPSKGLNI